MNKLMILSGVALLGLTGPAGAQAPGQGRQPPADVTRAELIQRTDAAFARLDVNRDGRFTREEAQAMGQQRRQQRMTRMFDRLDADDNGQISREEFAQGRRGPGRRGHGGAVADRSPDGPGMRPLGRGRRGGPGMRMRMGARLFGEAGFVTAEQFRARALERFDRADANHDGTLTVAERQARRGEMRGRFRHRMGPPPVGPDAPPPPNPAG